MKKKKNRTGFLCIKMWKVCYDKKYIAAIYKHLVDTFTNTFRVKKKKEKERRKKW